MIAYHQKFLALPAPKPEDAWRNDWLVVATYAFINRFSGLWRKDVFTAIRKNGVVTVDECSTHEFDACLRVRFGTHYDFPLVLYDWRPDLIVLPHTHVLDVMARLHPLTEKTS